MVLDKANYQRKQFSLKHTIAPLTKDKGVFSDNGIDFKKVADHFIDKY